MIIIKVVLISFLCSWIAKMLDFAMNYNHILSGLKMRLANQDIQPLRKYQINCNNGISDPIKSYSEREAMFDSYISTMSQYSKLLALLCCVYCLTVWVSILAVLVISVVDFSWFYFSIPIVSFFITNKT